MIQNSTVMGALTRVLQEEYKKSMDLTFNILRLGYTIINYYLHTQVLLTVDFLSRIFLAFSNFAEMHSLMASFRIGVLTMKVRANSTFPIAVT